MSTPESPGEGERTTSLAEDLDGLTDLFSQLGAPKTPSSERPESPTAAAGEAGLPELELDGFDNDRYGSPGIRTVSHSPVVEGFIAKVSPNNLNLVPISPTRLAEGYCLETPMIRDTSPSNFALEIYEVIVDDAPLDGFTTRVVQARLAAETGATASRAPLSQDWDIRVVDKEHYPQGIHIFPTYVPICIPSDLSPLASSAMLSLFVPGGAGAYTWRFRGDNDVRADYMPSCVRFGHPGGEPGILAIYDKAPDQIVFGGSALTVANLKELEHYYRRKWGDYYWDQAYKTVAALSAVYLAPVPNDRPLGVGFSCVEQTTIHAGVDLQDHVATAPGPSPWGFSEISNPFSLFETVPRCFDTHAVRALSIFKKIEVPMNTQVTWDLAKNKVTITVAARYGTQDHCMRLDRVLLWIARPANGTPRAIASLALKLRAVGRRCTLAQRYRLAGSEDDEGKPYHGFRNVYGFNDASQLTLPIFDVRCAVFLLAGVHLPHKTPGKSYINFDRLWDWIRVYALRLHICHAIKLVEHKLWPDDLHLRSLEHGNLVKSLPSGLACLTHISKPSRRHLSAINWQLLEPIHYLKARESGVEYYGYDVAGYWDIDDRNIVRVGSKETDYAALDAAVRHAWMTNCSVETVGRTTEDLQPVLDTNGLIAPFALSPFSSFFRFMLPISITGDYTLRFGFNKNGHTVTTS